MEEVLQELAEKSVRALGRKPNIVLRLRDPWQNDIQIETGIATIQIEIKNGKLGKVLQTETIKV